MDREPWRATVHGVTKELQKSQQLNNNNKEWEKIASFPCNRCSQSIVPRPGTPALSQNS